MLLLESLLRSSSGIKEQGAPCSINPLPSHRQRSTRGRLVKGLDEPESGWLAGNTAPGQPARFRPLTSLRPVCSLLGSDGEG
jgi:hypothetical protein